MVYNRKKTVKSTQNKRQIQKKTFKKKRSYQVCITNKLMGFSVCSMMNQ